MEQFNINQVENANITLNTVKGLAEAINDLLIENSSLLYDYPSADKGKKYQADRLADKLLALSSAATEMTDKTEQQIDHAINSYANDHTK